MLTALRERQGQFDAVYSRRGPSLCHTGRDRRPIARGAWGVSEASERVNAPGIEDAHAD